MMTRGRRLYFTKGYAKLIAYIGRNGETRMDPYFKTSDGFRLGEWLTNIREKWAAGELMPDEERKLIAAGIAPEATNQTWEDMYRLAEDYYHRNHNLDVALNYRSEDGALLGAWIYRQKKLVELKSSDELSKYQINQLKKIGIK